MIKKATNTVYQQKLVENVDVSSARKTHVFTVRKASQGSLCAKQPREDILLVTKSI